MKRLLFSERMGQQLPRVKESLDRTIQAALFQIVQSRMDDNSFGLSFPSQCEDGHGNAGADDEAVRLNMAGYRLIVPASARTLDSEEITDTQVFDLIEYTYEHVAKPLPGNFHSFFGHYHTGYDQATGRKDFADEVNRLFERNGIAYELREGQVERLAPSVLQEVLVHPAFNTRDTTLDEILGTAREKFLNRDLKVRREALEKLWDAWERLKSLSDTNDKKRSVQILLDRAAAEPNFRARLEGEAKQLTEIGNSFFIRHTEVTKPHIVVSRQVDYLFHRLFALIRLLLQAQGIDM
jgi:hypothetical protein